RIKATRAMASGDAVRRAWDIAADQWCWAKRSWPCKAAAVARLTDWYDSFNHSGAGGAVAQAANNTVNIKAK
ncbi:hypothetical protein RZS08_20970, partial [Arthrospira platensis SPKY1]|nr:hypothetical protein [Arthrospira platensis SPKY1]